MEENLELGSVHPEHLISKECIIAAKVYGKCRQQDCLRPDFVEPEPGIDSIPITGSLSGETTNITNIGEVLLPIPITPNSKIITPNGLVKSGKVVDSSLKVSSIEITTEPAQNLFASDGYYKVTIRYTFTYKLQLIGTLGTPLTITLDGVPPTTQDFICAYSVYEKQIVLFGGVGNPDIYVASNLFANVGPYTYQNAPYVTVQAKANVLTVNIGSFIDPCVEPVLCPSNIIGVTIGLFTIIKLFRLVNMTVQTTGNCDIPLCEPIIPGDPCSFFNEIPFPFDDFDPPTS